MTQNGQATKLYRNEAGRPGLRVRVSGPAGNRTGIGSLLRLDYADGRRGPAREIHGGSGYLSQDAAEVVMGTPVPPRFLHVRFPGGGTTRALVPAGAHEITVDATRLRGIP